MQAALLAMQLPANVPGKTTEDEPSTWAPTTCIGDLAPSFRAWLSSGHGNNLESELAHGRSFSLCLYLFLSLGLSAIQITAYPCLGNVSEHFLGTGALGPLRAADRLGEAEAIKAQEPWSLGIFFFLFHLFFFLKGGGREFE